MHTNKVTWILLVFVLLIGMNCSLFSGAGNSPLENEQATPPPMPTAEGTVEWNDDRKWGRTKVI